MELDRLTLTRPLCSLIAWRGDAWAGILHRCHARNRVPALWTYTQVHGDLGPAAHALPGFMGLVKTLSPFVGVVDAVNPQPYQ